jgi:hypothetical protein
MWAATETGPVGGSGGHARETTLEGASLLERLARAGMIDRGRVVLIGLDALRDRFGERWEKKAELIWQVALHHIKKRIGPDDLCARVGDCEAVIAVAGDSSRAASLGLAISQELMTYFLGQARPSDLRLNRVISVDGREIGVEPLPTEGVEVRPLAEQRSFAPPPEPLAPHPDWSALSLQGRGMKLDERFVMEPVISLKQRRTAANRIGVTVIDERAGGRLLDTAALSALTPVELLALDAGVIDHALAQPDTGAALILPLSFQTLSTSRGRALLLQRGGGEAQLAARRPIIEITGLDNAPQGRLTEVVSLIAPACRAVVAQLDGRLEASRSRWLGRLEALRGCRLGGISIDFAARKDTSIGRLAGLVTAAREFAPLAFTFNVPDARGLADAFTIGFTHAALKTEADD